MTRTFVPMCALLLVVGLMFLVVLGGAGTLNHEHADVKHAEAPAIRATYRSGACEGVELWFSPPRGTVLALCGLPQTLEWGGMIYRVTESGGSTLLGDEAYECTVFAARRPYWDGVIRRDEYVPLGGWPDVARQFKELTQ